MNQTERRVILLGTIIGIIVFVLLAVFMPRDLLLTPLMTPSEILSSKPSITIGSIVILVPSSTVIVYILGIQILLIGFLFYRVKLRLWAWSFYLWGFGTILAGTSYQAFGYELKCDGLEYCLFTSWFELSYLFVTALSITIMSFAFAKTFLTGKAQSILRGYPLVMMFLYTILLLVGAIGSIQFLISYELFTVFFMPLFVIFFVFNILGYRLKKDPLNRSFIVLWILFLIVNVSYYGYYLPGFTESLYNNTGIWFSANDVLHVGLILWFLYIQFKIKPLLLLEK